MPQCTIEQAYEIALQCHRDGQLPQAEAIYRQILGQEPNHADSLHMLGLIAHQAGQFESAVQLIGQAIALKPGSPEACTNLGNALRSTGRLDEAIASYRQAIALQPNSPEAYSNLGNVLQAGRQWEEAIACHHQAIALKPDLFEARYNLGNALHASGQLGEAIAAYRQAIILDPHRPEALYNLGNALRAEGQLDEAIVAYRQAIALRPDLPEVHCNLGSAAKDTGQLHEAIAALNQAIAIRPDFHEAHSNLVYALHFHPDYDAEAIAEEHRRWNRRHAEPLKRNTPPHDNDRNPDRRLRIGYVSPDFYDHVIGRNLLPLFHHHDRRQFHITCYTQVRSPDSMTARFQQCADDWRNIAGLPDEQVAQLVHRDRIDVLVDLTLHLAHHRLLVFARKPAPVQVTFAGYPGSTGLSEIDYRLSDPYLDPPGMDESVYSERTMRLPHAFWCYDPLDSREIPVNALPALTIGIVTFGCLNNFCKVNEDMLSLWAQVLRQVEGSRLLLLAKPGHHRERTAEFMACQGVEAGRLEFLDPQPRHRYLELYHRIDLGLDSFPYNGHTTSLDSLWMGAPVITRVGQTAVARAGWCHLSNLGLTELAGHTPEQFVQLAVELAGNLPRLEELRRTLRQRMEQSPLMDAPRYARDIESAYRAMWRRWCEGE